MARLSPKMREWLLKTSILDRFCPELCDAVCAADVPAGTSEIDGQQFVDVLRWGNLFTISLDARGEWHRYHHLFQALLDEQLERRSSREEISALHGRACEWFENRGFIDDALHHALAAGDTVAAAEIVERHRHAELDMDRWYVVKRWLDLLPEETKQQRTALLLAQVRPLFEQYRLMEIPPLLERVGPLLARESADEALMGELDFYRGYLLIWLMGDAAGALNLLESAQKKIPPTNRMLTAEVELYLALARQMIGEGPQAIESLEEKIRAKEPTEGLFLSHLIGARVFIHLLSGELGPATIGSQRLIAVKERGRNAFSDTWGLFTRANAQLQLYQLEDALQGFSSLADRRDALPKKAVVEALAGLALTYVAMNQVEKAQATLKQLLSFARESGDPGHVAVAESSRARISLLLGDTRSAIQWARLFTVDHHAPSMLFFLEIPSLTQARAQIAAGTDEEVEQVLDALANLHRQVEALHNTFQVIEISVLQAASLERLGRRDEALSILEESVGVAGGRGWIRPFLEPGASVVQMLENLLKKKIQVAGIEPILSVAKEARQRAIPDRTGETLGRSQHDRLTNREHEILELLAERMRDKEIAARLFISAQTVNSHLKNIYEKMDVTNRRQAVARALEHGILSKT
jgi:LuxR family maltose regulon positive regulatory protein